MTRPPTENTTTPPIPYGVSLSGDPIALHRLRNENGMEVEIINYGAIIASIKVPDRDGKIAEITLGHDKLAGWEEDPFFLGATIGRFANRIAQGRFSIDGKSYELPINDDPNSLHGGHDGFDKRIWAASPVVRDGRVGVELALVSKDGEQGYPGNLTVQVAYTLGQENDLRIDYRATTDAPTVINLTNHAYFDLGGRGDIVGHVLRIPATFYTPTDDAQIPTGQLAPVDGTPFDFRKPERIGLRIDDAAGGYDHNFVLGGEGLREAALVFEPESGRVMEVLTSEPGIQFYSGNKLEGLPGRAGRTYPPRSGFCLETQHFPDSPNHPHFPSTVLCPGEVFTSTTIYRFSTR
jgi:aldose 1-epimerase